MTLINTSKTTTSLTNTTKVSFGETWATITHTWANEIRTWMATGSLLTNSSRQSSSLTNIAKPT